MGPKKYLKKPVETEAMRVEDSYEKNDEAGLFDWIVAVGAAYAWERNYNYVTLFGGHGAQLALPTDYVVREESGEMYALGTEEFQEGFEEVNKDV